MFIFVSGSSASPATTAATAICTTSPTSRSATSLWLWQHNRHISWPRFGEFLKNPKISSNRCLLRLSTKKQIHIGRGLTDYMDATPMPLLLPLYIRCCCHLWSLWSTKKLLWTFQLYVLPIEKTENNTNLTFTRKEKKKR